MRKIKKSLITALLAVLASVTCLFCVSCKKDDSVTVSFNTNGGVAISAVQLDEGESYLLTQQPTREGYSFEGWYADADFTGEPVTQIVANGDMTLYAKWEQMYEIAVELDGGTLSTNGKLYIKAGQNVYDFMQAYEPTKDGVKFGAWFLGENELSKNTRMPSEKITLTAKYKTKYVVEIWEQKLTLDGYEKRAEDIIGYEYSGVEFTSEQKVTGFSEVVKNDEVYTTVSELTISSDATKNIFRHYFDRQSYEVIFNANYPDGSTSDEVVVEKIYGESIEVPSDYAFEGYCLLGWSTSPSGDVVYKANYIEQALYGNTNATKADVVKPDRDMVLYAVWLKGYVDMFQNSDYIFLFEKEVVDADTNQTTIEYSIYLSRGGILFEGEYKPATKKFIFVNANDTTLVEGKLNDNGTFVYSDLVRADYAFTLFEFGKGLNSSVKAYFDAYDGITYATTKIVNEQEVSVESTGTYYIDEDGYYIAVFNEGELAGQTLTMTFGSVTDQNGVVHNAFQVRNEVEYAMGKLVRFAVYQSMVTYYTLYDVTLDGFSTAYMNTGNSYQAYYYMYDEEKQEISFYDSYGEEVAVSKIMEYDVNGKNVKGYAIYSADYDKTYTYAGAKLTLDGFFNAKFEKGGVKVEGLYILQESLFGGTIVTMYAKNGTVYKFLITAIYNEVDLNNTTVTVVTYKVEEKHELYAEYYYETYTEKNGSNIFPTHILVVNDKALDTAVLYGATSTGGYFEVSRGSFVADSTTGLYTYTAQEFADLEVELVDTPIDFTVITAMVCALDTQTTSYSITYWYSYTTEEDGTVSLKKEYTSIKDNATLTLVSGIAIYRADGAIILGIYKTDTTTGITTIANSNGYLYVELKEQDTFIVLDHAPYSAYLLGEDGESYSKSEYLTLDGKGGITYTVITGTGNEQTTTVYYGTMTDTNRTTLSGAKIYTFSGTTKDTLQSIEFEYIELFTSSLAFFAKQGEIRGEFVSQKDGILNLDGYAYWATYTDTQGYTYEGKYYVESESVVYIDIEGYYFYFDLDGTAFTLRGFEFGTYIYFSNQYANGIYFDLDGYGGLSVYVMEYSETTESYEKKSLIAEKGSYVISDNDVTLTYTEIGASAPVSLVGSLDYYGDYPVFMEYAKEGVARTYVNGSDLSVLALDIYGNAIRYTKTGEKEYGTYTLITDNLLFYLNNAGTNAYLYRYDSSAGIATIINLEARGYYTADLESLLFSQYGFAIFGGKTQYYYEINEDEIVTIYRQAERGEAHNGYGFVAETFGEYKNEVKYNGKTYFATDGLSIVFKRNEQTKNNYPVTISNSKVAINALSFAPTGDGEFTVVGKVLIGDKSYDCYVTRINGTNGVEMYFTVGYYRFDITVVYNGDNLDGTSNNTYEITNMRLIVQTHAYDYLTMAYICQLLAGYTPDNTYGQLDIVVAYDVDGNETGTYLDGVFYHKSGAYTAEGELLAIKGATIYDFEGNALEFADITVSGDTLYVVHIESGAYTYHLYFVIGTHDYTGTYAYRIYALTREETLSSNGYSVTIERVIVSDYGVETGYLFLVEIMTGEGDTLETIRGEAWFKKDGYWYLIIRERENDTDVITKTTYYKIALIEKDSTVEKNPLAVYESATITKEEVETLYSADGCYVDINKTTNKAMILAIDGTQYIVTESTYDETTKTYTVKLTSTRYTIKVEDDNSVTITKVVEDDE